MGKLFIKNEDNSWNEVEDTEYEAINNALEISSLSKEELCLQLSSYKETDLSEWYFQDWNKSIYKSIYPIYYGENINDLISYTIKYGQIKLLDLIKNDVHKAYEDKTIDNNKFVLQGDFLIYDKNKVKKLKTKKQKEEKSTIVARYVDKLYSYRNANHYLDELIEKVIEKNLCYCNIYLDTIAEAEEVLKKIRKINKYWKKDKSVQALIEEFFTSYEWFKTMPDFVVKRRKEIRLRKETYTKDMVKFFKKYRIKEIVKAK